MSSSEHETGCCHVYHSKTISLLRRLLPSLRDEAASLACSSTEIALHRFPASACLPLVQAAQLAAEGKVEEADELLAAAAASAGITPQQRQHLLLMRAHLAASHIQPTQVCKLCLRTGISQARHVAQHSDVFIRIFIRTYLLTLPVSSQSQFA